MQLEWPKKRLLDAETEEEEAEEGIKNTTPTSVNIIVSIYCT
jgi:hypothetical protein